MKKYIPALFFYIMLTNLNAQSEIDSVKVFPSVIYENDTVFFIDFVTLSGLYTPNTPIIQKAGNLIRLERKYFLSGFPTDESGSDTAKLGTFPEGEYEILFLKMNCYSPTYCSDFDTAIIYFTVFGPNNVNNIDDDRGLTLYPNPTDNQLTISTTGLPAGQAGFQPQTITIYDLSGRQVKNLPFTREVDISILPPGVYFVEVTGKDATEIRKLVKL